VEYLATLGIGGSTSSGPRLRQSAGVDRYL
jgi:hypothetical protein